MNRRRAYSQGFGGRNGVTEMKVQHFLSGATLLSAALLLNAPLSAVVESDVVGYTTITMEAGKWYLLGCPFTPLNGETTTQINETFAGEGFASGDVLYTLTEAGTYKPYYWHQDESNSGWSTHKVLWREDTTEYPITDAVYIRKTVNGEITFSGSVAAMKVPLSLNVYKQSPD